jgi:hypothetical protein
MKTVAREKAAPAPAVEISGSLNELFEKTLAENRAQAAKEKWVLSRTVRAMKRAEWLEQKARSAA